MQNFIFHNPTKIIFGKGEVKHLGKETAKFGKKALLVYGKSSILKNGVYDQVTTSLKQAGVAFVDFPGVKSNPVLSHVEKGIELARKEKWTLFWVWRRQCYDRQSHCRRRKKSITAYGIFLLTPKQLKTHFHIGRGYSFCQRFRNE